MTVSLKVGFDRTAKFAIIAVDRCRPHLQQLSLALPPSELNEANRFRQPADSERFIISRALLRYLCAAHLRVRAEAITFRRAAGGKPYVESESPLSFSLSHSGNCVALAWSTSGPVGIDVEATEPRDRQTFLEAGKRVFSSRELVVLVSVDDSVLPECFYRIWVRKEAVAKAHGAGIGAELRSFSVAEKSASSIAWSQQVRFPSDGSRWNIHELLAPPGHLASVAVPDGTRVEESDLPELFGLRQTRESPASRQSGSNR